MARDPWAQFADAPPLELGPQPAQQNMGLPEVVGQGGMPLDPEEVVTATAESAPPGPDPFAQFSDANPGGMVDPQMIGGFADELPEQASTQMADEDKAELLHILTTYPTAIAAAKAREFAAAKGFAGPDTFDDVIRARDDGYGVTNDVVVDLPKLPDQGATGSFGRGLADVPTFGILDELGAVIDTLGGTDGRENVWNSEKSVMDLVNRNIDINRGIIQADEEYHPVARIAGQLLGGLPIPAGTQGVALRAGTMALREGRTMQEARAIAQQAVTARMAQVGGGVGALYGFGSTDGNIADRAIGAGIGGATGAAIGFAGGKAGEFVAPKREAARVAARATPENLSDGQQVLAAAQRQGISPFPADVGGPITRGATSAAVQTIGGAGPIVRAAQKTVSTAQAVRDRVAASIGSAIKPEPAGETARRGANSFIARTSQRARTLYGVATAEAGDARIVPTRALAKLDEHIADLSETPGGADGLARLQGLRDVLSNGDFTVRGLRNMRTALNDDFAESGLRGSDIARRVGQVVDAATDDIVAGLRAQGKGKAARMFETADRYWRNRIDTIDNVLTPIIGKDGTKSGEKIVKALQADARDNNRRFVSFLRALPPEEQQTVRATLISRMGRATKGNQNEDGDAFSLSTFLSNWDDMEEGAKAATFGPEGRAALNDLATVAHGSRQAQATANKSNTGGAVANIATGATLALDFATFGKTLAVQYGAGRLLASPRFARWLARAPRNADRSYVERLSRIATSEPAIANEVLQLQTRLRQAFLQDGPARLAADKPDNHGGGIEGQNQQGQPNQEQPQ